jgi:uncharacterized protein
LIRRWIAAGLWAAWAAVAPAWPQSPAPAAATDSPSSPAVDGGGLLAVPPLARVVDPAGLLRGSDLLSLQARLEQFEKEHGAQVAIVLVASTGTEPIEDFANRVGNAWKIGRRGVGDGLLIVVAAKDRHARIEVARALEGAIPDVIARRVVQQTMGPRFKQGDYAGGLSAGLDQLLPRIVQEQVGGAMPATGGQPSSSPDDLGRYLPLLVLAVAVGAILRRVAGLGGALGTGILSGIVASFLVGSIVIGAIIALAIFLFSIIPTRAMGYGGSGYPGHWGGGGGGGGGGGFSSGGGGDFSGGGASGDW